MAIPSETTEGLSSKRSDHFGHCPVFTLVEIKNNQVTGVRSVENIAHDASGCMKPVAMLAENGVSAIIVTGMGRGPFQKMAKHGITAYFADPLKYPDAQSTVNEFINGSLPAFADTQLCTGSGNCHH